MDELTKEQVLAMIGSTEGFSAESVREQLEIRQRSVADMLARFRENNGLAKEVVK